MCRWRSLSPTAPEGRRGGRCGAAQIGLVAMVGHTRRFNPSHQFVRRRILDADLLVQQMHAQTFSSGYINMNAVSEPRSWTDHLLWHHAAHTVDLFAYLAARRS